VRDAFNAEARSCFRKAALGVLGQINAQLVRFAIHFCRLKGERIAGMKLGDDVVEGLRKKAGVRRRVELPAGGAAIVMDLIVCLAAAHVFKHVVMHVDLAQSEHHAG